MIYWISHCFFVVLSWIFCPLKVLGRERLPKREGFIIASNHISNLDPLVLGVSSGRRLSYLAKESLFKNRILRFILHRVGAFPIRRGAPDFRAIRETMRRLKKGSPVVFFPEGTRKASGGEKRAQSGIGLIAAKSGAPVVPALIKDSDRVLAPGSKKLKRHRVTVVFGVPLRFSEEQPYPEIANEVMEGIRSLVEK